MRLAPVRSLQYVIPIALVASAAVSGAQVIPLKPGVVLTYATQPVDSTARFDFEREIAVTSVSPVEWVFDDEATNTLKPSNKVGTIKILRTVSHREATLAHAIWLGNVSPDLDQHRGTTWMAASAAVMKQLRGDGQAEVTVGTTGLEGSATLQRVDANPVPISVLVNGQPQVIPTMHTQITYSPGMLVAPGQTMHYDIWFVDDTSNAWVVKLTGTQTLNGKLVGREGLQALVRVQWSDDQTAKSMGDALGKSCRVQAYGIHFASGSAELTPSSDPTLKEIGDLMAKNPTWQLTIEGHTDSVGGAAYNKDLSDRRTAAVKTALTTSYGVAASRLTTIGYGLTRPVDKNSTLEGRAKNRRVELARKC